MKTTTRTVQRNGFDGRFGRGALALCALLAGVGCAPRTLRPAAEEAPVEDAKEHFFTFEYSGECPVKAVGKTTDPSRCPGNRTDCVVVSKNRGEQLVGFRNAGTQPRKDFAIHFDPFSRIPTYRGQPRAIRIPATTPEATYKFSVVTENCAALDPVIIVQY